MTKLPVAEQTLSTLLLHAGGKRLRPATRARRHTILQTYPAMACAYALKEQLRAV